MKKKKNYTLLLCIAFCLFSCISEDKPKVSAGQIDTVTACPDENQVGINQIDTEITSKNKDMSDTTIIEKPKYRYSEKDYENITPYLITNNGAGYFLLGGIISDSLLVIIMRQKKVRFMELMLTMQVVYI
ncbi:MAG TPA: hypothetical protein PKW49_13120 [Paludibacteraceae bacterium]|nr:hypothetical protein [Paludibacteraceae bacterium]HQF51196.1 hypothetical protein [Paludibacteraceae bacterium]HQJ89761.1 hypothetical protein [Paludibacteraceae bacterium]